MSKDIKKPTLFLIFAVLMLILEASHLILAKIYFVSVNSGFIFGLLKGNFLAIAIALLLLYLLYSYSRKSTSLLLPFIVLASGGVINIFDRSIFGGSRDYFNLWFIPTFNIADAAIVVGGGWLLLNILLYKKSSE